MRVTAKIATKQTKVGTMWVEVENKIICFTENDILQTVYSTQKLGHVFFKNWV